MPERAANAVNKSGTAEDMSTHAFVSCSFLPEMKAFFHSGAKDKEVLLL